MPSWIKRFFGMEVSGSPQDSDVEKAVEQAAAREYETEIVKGPLHMGAMMGFNDSVEIIKDRNKVHYQADQLALKGICTVTIDKTPQASRVIADNGKPCPLVSPSSCTESSAFSEVSFQQISARGSYSVAKPERGVVKDLANNISTNFCAMITDVEQMREDLEKLLTCE